MMLKLYLTSFIACFLVLNSFAQKQNVYFLKNDGRYVNLKDSADFIRIVREPDSGTVLYNVLDYYLNGNLKMLGKTTTIKPVQLEGTIVSYYPNGNKKNIINYETGYPKGLAYDYYPNGKLYRSLIRKLVPAYGDSKFKYDKKISDVQDTSILHINNIIAFTDENIKSVFDSTGIQTVKDGRGHCKFFNMENETFEEEGELENGKKTGIWKSILNKGKFIIIEEYDNGVFVRGTCAAANRPVISYAAKEVLPSFSGEENALNRYVSKNVQHPTTGTEKTHINGQVYLSFLVEKDGSITGIKIKKNFSNVTDAEVVMAMSKSPKWNPGLQHGIPVRVAFFTPINFTFNK